MASAIGKMIKEAGAESTVVRVSMDEVVVEIGPSARGPSAVSKRHYRKRRRKWREGEPIEWEGESHSPEEWAKKLKLSRKAVLLRWNRWGDLRGNPAKCRPSNADKIIAG
jgi:hypothetical protein